MESISQLTLAIHRQCFPNLDRLLSESLRYENYFSAATSTRMVQTYLFHGNDFELDQFSAYSDAVAAGNCDHLFAILKTHGYHAGLACLNLYHNQVPAKFSVWPKSISVPFDSADPEAVMAEMNRMTDERPFAVFFLNLKGTLRLLEITEARPHYLSAIPEGEAICHSISRNFAELRGNLSERIAAKSAYRTEKLPSG